MARIRSLKPEFWTHPIMGRQKPEDQLLAIALLNHADDEGYFRADENIIRGSVFPFRETLASISRGLASLSEVGWIELCNNPTQGKIGRVINWSKHQKIDHPSASKIKIYWIREELSNPREELSPDQGAASREQGKEHVPAARKKHAFEKSEFFLIENFRAALSEWSEQKCNYWHKKAKGYSDANGGRYLNWVAAIRNWDSERPYQEFKEKGETRKLS